MTTATPAIDVSAAVDVFAVAGRAARWLDDRNGTGLTETALRLLKVTEEAGEAAAAYIGATGQNPRKGTTGTNADVAAELADVVLAALVAMHALGCNPPVVMTTCLAKLAARLPADTPTGRDPDVGDPRVAATLRFLLDAHTTHHLPLPDDIETNTAAGVLRLNVADDQPELVHRWAALLGADVRDPRDSRHGNATWVTVTAETPWDVDGGRLLGWCRIEIRTTCGYTIAAPTVVATAA